MKKPLLALLTICLLFALALPAYAVEGDDPDVPVQEEPQEPPQEQPPEAEPVVVGTLEELQAAIDAAEDGDTIAISKCIFLNNETLITNKHLRITRTNDFSASQLFFFEDAGIIEGFDFVDTLFESLGRNTITVNSKDVPAQINNCRFIEKGKQIGRYISFRTNSRATVNNCTFYDCNFLSIMCEAESEVVFDSCLIRGSNDGAIYSYGVLTLNNCEITDNYTYSGGAVYSNGELIVNNCKICDNGTHGQQIGFDISSIGLLTINVEPIEGEGFYNKVTGDKYTLPLVKFDEAASMVYMTDEEAAVYFAPKQEQEPQPDDEEPGSDTDDPDDEEQQQPGTDQPSPTPGTDEQEDDPQQNPTQQPQEPDNTDQVQDDTPNQEPSQEPQNPTDGGNSGNDDVPPPVIRRPTIGITKPDTTTTQPEPEPQPVDKPVLRCNGATLDTSRTIVLLGYGDGNPHEEDSLTRAQLATIVYRLLTDESIAQYSSGEQPFIDVAADAWYASYIRAIGSLGIVNGVGGGRYDPEGVVSWAQIVTILTRFVEPQEYRLQNIQYEGWAAEAIQTAVALGWIEDSANFNPDAIISRGDLVRLVNGVLAMYR